MLTKLSPGASVGEFTITNELKEDFAFKWVTANSKMGSKVLQILRSSIPKDERAALFDYFNCLHIKSGKKGPVLPESIFSDPANEYPLVVVYPDLGGEKLSKALAGNNDVPDKLWHEVCEILFALHQSDIFVGWIDDDYIKVSEGQPYFYGFGYAPLINSSYKTALEDCAEQIPPEVHETHNLNAKSDMFAFAKMVAELQPDVKNIDWYLNCTSIDPAMRPKTIRNVITLPKPGIKPIPDRKPTEPELPVEANPRVKPKIDLFAVPENAGRIEASQYSNLGDIVTFTAFANKGWKFSGWSGDLNSSVNPCTLIVNADKSVKASFVRGSSILPIAIVLSLAVLVLLFVVRGHFGWSHSPVYKRLANSHISTTTILHPSSHEGQKGTPHLKISQPVYLPPSPYIPIPQPVPSTPDPKQMTLEAKLKATHLVKYAESSNDQIDAEMLDLSHEVSSHEVSPERFARDKQNFNLSFERNLRNLDAADRTWKLVPNNSHAAPLPKSEVERVKTYLYLGYLTGDLGPARRALAKGKRDHPHMPEWVPLTKLIGR